MSPPTLPPESGATKAEIDAQAEAYREGDKIPGKIQQVTDGLLAKLRRSQSKGVKAIETFLPDWTKACRGPGGGQGIAMGQMVVVAGPSGAGKTLAALNLVASALRQGFGVLYFSLEMTWGELAVRLRPIVTGQDITQYEYGSGYSEKAAEAADQELITLPGKLHVNTEPIWQLSHISSAMESAYQGSGVRLFVVDYAQLVAPSGSDQRLFEAMTWISTELRYTAKKLGAATVVVSQLNRETTRDRTAPPTIDGLFGSSRLGHDADQVLILDLRKSKRAPERRAIRMDMVLAKNRNGPQDTIPVELSTATLRFRQIMPDEEASWPAGGS